MLEIKFTELGIEIRVREEIERGITPEDVSDPSYPPGNLMRYASEEALAKWQIDRTVANTDSSHE
jgi:hypothetical protein